MKNVMGYNVTLAGDWVSRLTGNARGRDVRSKESAGC